MCSFEDRSEVHLRKERLDHTLRIDPLPLHSRGFHLRTSPRKGRTSLSQGYNLPHYMLSRRDILRHKVVHIELDD